MIVNPVQVNFRMSAALKQRLEEAAKESGRSVTAEINARLEHSFDSRRAFESNKTLAERLALADELTHLARGLMLQEIEIAKSQGREIDLDAAKQLSNEAVERAKNSDK